MKKKIIKFLLITTLSTLILTGCKDSAETTSNVDETTETTSVIESNEVAENTSDATSETTSTSETSETESNSASAIETSESETDSTTETTTEPVSTSTMETPVEEEVKVEYTYTDMNQKMCALSAVNVRDLPSTDGNKVDSLSYGERVVVTGRCNETGWYRIGNGRYVSDKYLVSESEFQPSTGNNGGTTDNGGGNTDASTTTSEAVVSSEFIAILNAKRAEAGLSPVSMDSSLDSTALAGARELQTNMSHNVAGGGYDRCNIGYMSSVSVQGMFDGWWNSEGHRAQMMDPYLTHASAAYCNGYIIYIGNIDDDAYARDIAAQLNQGSTSTPTDPVSSNDVGGGQTVDTTVTDGSTYNPTDEERQAAEDAFANW